jgi:hypothetical protein
MALLAAPEVLFDPIQDDLHIPLKLRNIHTRLLSFTELPALFQQ